METTIEARQEARKIFRAGKEKPCARCGEVHPYYVMEYHHTTDRLGIRKRGWGLTQYCRGTTLDEIPGCAVVCANCHRIIHMEARAIDGHEAREDVMAAAWVAGEAVRKEKRKQRWKEMKEHWKALSVERQRKNLSDILALVPAEGSIPKSELITLARVQGMGKNKIWTSINELLASGALVILRVPRPGTNPRVDLSKPSQF
jgi:NAD-dependent dihydropyrimidine dehydrogenase PreA subunit